jgi:predicted HAD superfamily Cof-like phosphohydrolase
MIILEGPDNGGKSTLAAELARITGLPVQGSEGPPHYMGEMNERIRRYLDMPATIFDRFPAISNPIYDRALQREADVIDPALISEVYARQPVLVYCDPGDRGLTGHVVKTRETVEHIEGVQRNQRYLCDLYQAWAMRHANMIYRIGDDKGQAVRRIISAFDVLLVPDLMGDMAAFHEKFKLAYDGPPRDLSPDLLQFRTKFMVEELMEYAFPGMEPPFNEQAREEVMRFFNAVSPLIPDDTAALAKRFDALIDLAYVALGTAYLHGFPFNEGWRRVQAANMLKVRAERASQSQRGSTFDVVKPPGWTAPVLDDLISTPA